MVKSGDVIENPITGEKMEFLQTSEDTDGSLLLIMLTVKSKGFVAAPHMHPIQEEHFLVKAGTLRLKTGDAESFLGNGREASIPRGTPHVWWNGSSDELKALMEVRPALQMEDFLTSLFALARAGKTNRMGVPNLLQIAVINRKYQHEIYLAKPSITAQRILFRSIAWIGLLLGYRADFPYRQVPAEKKSTSVDAEPATVPIENKNRR